MTLTMLRRAPAGRRATRNIVLIGALLAERTLRTVTHPRHSAQTRSPSMATNKDHRIVETATEARGGEPGPSILAMVIASTGLAIVILLALWFVFFRT